MKENDQTQRSNTMHIGQVVDQLITSYRLHSPFETARLIASWEDFVGAAIAKNTKRVYVGKGTLFVEMKSAALKHDLSFLKDKILAVLQKKMGSGVVDKIILL